MFASIGSLLQAQLRASVNNFLPGTGAVIQAFLYVPSGDGGGSEQWTPVASGTVNYRINPIQYGQLELLSLAEGIRIEYSIILPYNAPVSVGNRVVAGGTAYNIRVMQPDASNLAFVRCLVQRDQ